MEITTKDYDESLQSLRWAGSLITYISHRVWAIRLMHRLLGLTVGSQLKGFDNEEIQVPSTTTPDHSIRVRIYKPLDAEGPLPVMVYMHGGGYQVGVPEQDHPFYEQIVSKRKIAIVAPDYRCSVAHNSPYPHGLNDCYDVVQYCKSHAQELGLMDNQYALAGHSAGGGLTAALTLKVIDAKAVDLAFVMPVYPMLDHRMETKSAQEMIGTWVWDKESNRGAWGRYLADLPDPENVPDYASPALREELGNFPPTISWVGTLEPFKDEVIIFMEKLKKAGVPTQFHLFEGGFHGFETVGPSTKLGMEAMEFQVGAFAEYYDAYIQGAKK